MKNFFTKNFYVAAPYIITILLSGCAGHTIQYHPDNFVNPNRIVTKEVEKPVLPQVKASFGVGNDPAVLQAYRLYQKTGALRTVKGDGWITYPYSNHTKPIISCSMFHFCIVELETGEKLNSYGLGDTQEWQTNAFMTGEGDHASISIQAKPTTNHISTDLTISTNKRTYLIGLVAKPGADTTVLRFYYPEETLIQNVRLVGQMESNEAHSDVVSTINLPRGTKVDLNRLNFNYKIKGDNPPWRPLRIFDDGNKTYIEMPALASKFNLPVLYLARHQTMQMVNYRYVQPYFVIDGLFSHAWLVSGKGSDQERVEILNQNISE
ncbi:MAG: TrbG/VirB9 family P-type conjugative transfer protein [Gammaproteobacteria bacterium]|nr:TrbG/VirB9 family P-type conjugative transfer protein [Gammaproteobacteria bacterium]